jgi:hypothetical protein
MNRLVSQGWERCCLTTQACAWRFRVIAEARFDGVGLALKRDLTYCPFCRKGLKARCSGLPRAVRGFHRKSFALFPQPVSRGLLLGS